jgi:hypothetical protein
MTFPIAGACRSGRTRFLEPRPCDSSSDIARVYDSRSGTGGTPPRRFQIFDWRRRPGTGRTGTRSQALGQEVGGGAKHSVGIGALQRVQSVRHGRGRYGMMR